MEGWSEGGRDARQSLNLNTATESELLNLPGITQHDARRIVQNRPYQSTPGISGQESAFGNELREDSRPDCCEIGASRHSSIRVPSTVRNCASQAGCAGQAGALTRLPSVTASVIARSTNVPPARVTSGEIAG